MRFRGIVLVVSAIFLHAAASAAEGGGGGFSLSLDAGASPVMGHPYSAVSETRIIAPRGMDPNGGAAKSVETRSYRDSRGRIRYEIYAVGATASHNTPDTIVLIDSKARLVCTLQPSTHTAYFSFISDDSAATYSDESSPVAEPTTTNSGTDETLTNDLPNQATYVESTQELGMQIIQGLAVEGERTTRTLPGRAEGRDRVGVEIDEVWTSSELNLTMLAKHVDADGVETVTSVTHLDRSEPSATLFQIPRDYTVQRESGAQ